ncbi:DNA internalization-related competence protein ComEC/Rec2 [Rhodocyclus purpureus]|uniref:DNA internalization-related competence protein ComEC/Rec2 n=1 Tax=Rhodocyclus purpureus TaxID=1067 RepID=UPI001913CDE2|nr:DNA internalization-related competence protein ComEC/Rec2 [Rhodocyclus purpureus]MBK5914788.1 DNA internalization-related competence protein ComEC/Rec2 [Rhodocyclus purpureus]
MRKAFSGPISDRSIPSILAFAAGVFVLQQQAELPASANAFAIAAALLLVAFAASLIGDGARADPADEAHAGHSSSAFPPPAHSAPRASRLAAAFLATWLPVALAAALGFAYAGWRAAERLAEALPAALEGQDIEVVGIVSALPQRFERGERFEFTVESARLAGKSTEPTAAVKMQELRDDNCTDCRTAADDRASESSETSPKLDPLASVLPEPVEAQVRHRPSTSSGRTEEREGRQARSEDCPSGCFTETPATFASSKLSLSWYHRWDDAEEGGDAEAGAPRIRPGERWRFVVRLKRPHGNANPHGFDYEAWLFERGLGATGYVRSSPAPQRLDAFVAGPGTLVERARDLIRERFRAALADAPYAGVLVALTIGDQRAIQNHQWQVFNRTGVTHLMSISGLHVTMLAALCAALVNLLWRRSERLLLALPAQRAAVAAGFLAAFAYALLAGFAVPAQRTLYMLGVVALALWSGRHFGPARTLLLALLVVLLVDPWAVLAVGFWLSFGAVGVLLYVGSPRIGAVAGWRGRLGQWGTTQWAVTVGSLPLLLLLFQQFSLVSPLANAVAIPLVSFIVAPLALLYAVLPWPPLIALDHALLAFLMQWLEHLSGWPIWQQPAPPLWAVVLAVLGVACLLLPRGFPARWLGAVLLVPAVLTPPPRPPMGEAWLDTLDVGHGLAVVVRTHEHALLYDSGPRYGSDVDAGQRVVVPFLRAAGVRRLDTLMISHRDSDHAGGSESVLAVVPVARLLSSIGESFAAPAGDPAAEPCVAGQTWDWDGVRFQVLHPPASAHAGTASGEETGEPQSGADPGKARSNEFKGKPRTAANHLSCVLRIESAGGKSALLVGDIETADEAALLDRAAATSTAGGALKSDVLVAPHHGSRSSSSPGFVAAVAPADVVFTVGYRNRFRHPAPDVLARYADARQWRSDRDGAVTFVLADTVIATPYRPQYRRYWHWRPQ